MTSLGEGCTDSMQYKQEQTTQYYRIGFHIGEIILFFFSPNDLLILTLSSLSLKKGNKFVYKGIPIYCCYPYIEVFIKKCNI